MKHEAIPIAAVAFGPSLRREPASIHPLRSPGNADRLRAAAATFAITTGMLVLIGWATNVTALTQLVAGLTAMNPMTAVVLLVLGIVLLLQRRLKPQIIRLAAGATAVVGVTKIVQLLFDLPFGIDQLLFPERLGGLVGMPPNRMAPNAAIAIVLASLALALSKSRSPSALITSQILSLLVMGITLFALIGYILGIVPLYEVHNYNAMALHTAVALMALSIGSMCINSTVGLMKVIWDAGPAGQLSRVVLPLVVLVPVGVGVLRLVGERMGLYETDRGVALQVFANVVVTFILLMSSILALRRSDIARRERERAVKRSEDQYRLAEQMGQVGHWELDLSSGEMNCSDEFRSICGLTQDSRLSPDLILSLLHPDDIAAHRECMAEAAATGHGWDASRRIIRPDGAIRYIRSHGTSEVDDAGKIVTLFGVFVDTSEVELARRHAEAATAAKASFLATMSHEIRTPLNSIIGFTDLLLDDRSMSPASKRQVELVHNSGRALLIVINDILDFSKMEAGKVELELKPFELDVLVEDTVAIIRNVAEAKGLTLTIDLDRNLGQTYRGDSDRLRQILLNLLGNAVKFTPAGSVELEVSCEQSTAVGDRIRFAVRDSGIGVPADKENRLFEQFSQADSSVGRVHGGTGLGLAICKRLVGLMGGQIGYRAVKGGGSEFWFAIDAQPGQIGPPEYPEQALAKPQSFYILLVEDLEINQELATTMLTLAGHRVDVARDGKEAILAVQQKPYDLILMDIQMPGMDGITATKLIRLLPGRVSLTPIVAMSANVLPDQVRSYLDAGMDDHVGKPIDRKQLSDALSRNATRLSLSATNRGGFARQSFNEMTFRSASELLPPDRLDFHLGVLATQLMSLEKGQGNAAAPSAFTHKLITQAGMFGFDEIVSICQRIEAARSTGERARRVDELKQASRTALRIIAELRAPTSPTAE